MQIKICGYLILISALLFFSAGCDKGGKDGSSGTEKKAAASSTPAPFTLNTFSGKEVSLESLKGRPVLLNFWASWCGPCRAEAATLESAYKKYNPSGVEFLGVSLDESEAGARRFVEEFNLTFPIGMDSAGKIAKDYDIYGIPKTYMIDSDGKITYVHTGVISESDISREADKLINVR